MRFSMLGSAATIVAAVALMPEARAQFFDDFDSYAPNSAIEGQGTWQNWDTCATGNQAFNTASTAQASSGSQSLRMVGSDPSGCAFCSDTVSQLNGPYSTGQWTLSMQTYIPSNFFGQAYIIGLNDFADCGGPYNWSMQAHFESSNGMLEIDTNSAANPVSINGNQAILFDQWVEFRVDLDLDTDLATFWYNCVPMWSYTWSEGISGGGTATFHTLDLFPGTDDTTEWFLDDISFQAGISPNCPIGSNYCAANPNSTGVAASMGAIGSLSAAANDITLSASNMPNNSFGFFLTSQTQGLTIMPGGSQGNLCLGGAIGRYVGPGQIQNAGSAGAIALAVDLTMHPTPTGLVTVQSGDTWHFTAWYRDAVGGSATSNFADGLTINFQ